MIIELNANSRDLCMIIKLNATSLHKIKIITLGLITVQNAGCLIRHLHDY